MTEKLNTTKIVLRHVLVWLIFISYEVACIQFSVGLKGSMIIIAAYYFLYITLFYVNAHLILDVAFFRTNQPYLIAVALIIFEIMLFTVLKILIDHYILAAKRDFNITPYLTQAYLLSNVFREIFFIGFSIAYWSMLYMVRFREKNHQMEKPQLKSIASSLELENKYMSVENAYLQNQISPHLLFNSLNFIHNQVYKESAEAGNSVARLSDLMRYSLVNADDTRTVLLSQEVKQMENLIALCQMRFKNNFYLRFHKRGKLKSVSIIPLILITLVENMMKHGDLGDKRKPAFILLELKDRQLRFETRNKIRNTNLYPKNGLGLKNIEKRLTNYYQGKYTMLAGGDDETFNVNLIIDL